MAWRIGGMAILVLLGGCSAPPAEAPPPEGLVLAIRFVDDHLQPLANLTVSSTLVQCTLLDGLTSMLSGGWSDTCHREPCVGQTNETGWLNLSYDPDRGDPAGLNIESPGLANRTIDAPTSPLTVRMLAHSKLQVLELTAEPGVWLESATQVTPSQDVLLPFFVGPDPEVNAFYLQELESFRIRVEWENGPDGQAMLTAGYGREGRAINSYGVLVQGPYPQGAQVHEAYEEAWRSDWSGLEVGFQTGYPVIGTTPIPVHVVVEYTFDDPKA